MGRRQGFGHGQHLVDPAAIQVHDFKLPVFQTDLFAGLRQAAEHEPIVRVLPMLGVPHLDREFDYLVSAEQSDDAQPGVRVRVRFHGRLVDAFVLERRNDTDHDGRLLPAEGGLIWVDYFTVHHPKVVNSTSPIVMALVWGIIACRSRSLLYPILTHWLLGISLDLCIALRGTEVR